MDSSFENAILVLSKFKKETSAANEKSKPLIRFAGKVSRVSFLVDGVFDEVSKKSIRVLGNGAQLSVRLSRARFLKIVYFEPRELPEDLRMEGFVSYWHFTLANGDFFNVAEFHT